MVASCACSCSSSKKFKSSNINSLKEEDIKIFVNLSDTNKETVKIKAELPLNINLVDINPDFATVSIKK